MEYLKIIALLALLPYFAANIITMFANGCPSIRAVFVPWFLLPGELDD